MASSASAFGLQRRSDFTITSRPRPVLVLQHSMHHLPAWWLFPKDWILDFRLWIPELSVYIINSTICPCPTAPPSIQHLPASYWIPDVRLWIPELFFNSTTSPLSLSYYTPSMHHLSAWWIGF